MIVPMAKALIGLRRSNSKFRLIDSALAPPALAPPALAPPARQRRGGWVRSRPNSGYLHLELLHKAQTHKLLIFWRYSLMVEAGNKLVTIRG